MQSIILQLKKINFLKREKKKVEDGMNVSGAGTGNVTHRICQHFICQSPVTCPQLPAEEGGKYSF